MTAQLKTDFILSSKPFSEAVSEDEFDRVYRALDPAFVECFKQLKLSRHTLRELVYGIDHLDEVMGLEGCPVNKTLMTSDMETFKIESFFLFNELFRMTNNPSWKMALVPSNIKASLKEFFARDYLSCFHFIMTEMKIECLEITLDNRPISLEINDIVPDSKLHVLHYYDINQKKGINIPFARSRTGHVLKMKP